MIILIQIKPIEDLKENFHDIEKKAEEGEHIYLTKNGYGHMIMMSLDSFEKIVNPMNVNPEGNFSRTFIINKDDNNQSERLHLKKDTIAEDD